MIRNAPREAAVFGVDLGKNLFHVVGLDDRGGVSCHSDPDHVDAGLAEQTCHDVVVSCEHRDPLPGIA